jgi:hypothetical protein
MVKLYTLYEPSVPPILCWLNLDPLHPHYASMFLSSDMLTYHSVAYVPLGHMGMFPEV